MQHQPIFSDKYLEVKLSNYSLSDISDLEGKRQKITEWQISIRKGIIRKTKEEALQADFLNNFFGEVLGYDYNRTNDKWHLEKELKSVVDGSKADGALGYFSLSGSDTRVVIELKDAKTDLDKAQNRVDRRTPVEQAFSYANKAGGNCKWVIVSDFNEIRLYNATDQSRYELFNILELGEEAYLKKFFFLLSKDRLILETQKSWVDVLFEERQAQEQKISEEFYKDYKNVRLELFNHLKLNNSSSAETILFTKAQKILDRVIFICFCEDLNLIPKYTFRHIIKNHKSIIDFSESKLWDQVKNLFKAIDRGYPDASINKFNGGLFADDKELDDLIIKDSVVEHVIQLAEYDFASDLNVNILGHIFEQSISDIEEIKLEIEGHTFDEKKGKRKKDGIFYTPEYVTRFIVKEAVGGWLEDRKRELGGDKLPGLTQEDFDSIKIVKVRDKGQKRNIDTLNYNKKIERHIQFWEAYRTKLSHIRVLDPACGSGAFLNQVFDYLYKEGEFVNSELAKLKLGQREAFDLDKLILTNNLFGVDLNAESVEITKLSLWLKTANRHKELTALDDNIQCGNSLIDSEKVAKESAFKWEKKFKKIMDSGGFDVIVGNPPYVRPRTITDSEKAELLSRFKTATNQFDLYHLFIEKIDSIINDSGYASFIVPNTFLSNENTKDLRSFILENFNVNLIVDCKQKVFEDANVEASIFCFSKPISGNLGDFFELSSNQYTFKHQFDFKKFKRNKNFNFSVNISTSSATIFEKIKKRSQPLSAFFDVMGGIKEYQVGKGKPAQTQEMKDGNIFNATFPKDETFIPELRGKHLRPYTLNWENEYVSYGPWLAEPRNKKYFEGEKVLIRQIPGKRSLVCSYTEKDFIVDQTAYVAKKNESNELEYKYALCILNSKLVFWFFRNENNEFDDLFPKIKSKEIKALPIINAKPEIQKLFTTKADSLILLNKALENARLEFINYLRIKYSLEKPSNKIQDWYKLDFKNFLKELSKNKTKISPSEEFELMKLFEKERVPTLENFNTIAKIESEVNSLVYELYELSRKEIEVIEAQ